jgi:hypothetical protein
MIPEEQSAVCVYCQGKATTVDHIPPKNLFPRPMPSNLITVPACKDCNGGASQDDEYFRSQIIMKREVGGHRAAKDVAPTFFRSLTKPRKARFARAIVDNIRQVDEFTPGGVYLGSGAGYLPNHDRLIAVVQRIAIGLYFHEFGQPMPRAFEMDIHGFCDIRPGDRITSDKFASLFQSVVTLQPATQIGDGVFAYSFMPVSDRPDFTLWAMEFYESEKYLGFCGPIHGVGDQES